MTVSSATASATYTGNGTTTDFSVPFYFLVDGDLKISQKDGVTGVVSVLALNSDYTLTGAGNEAGGTASFATAPATGDSIYIERNVSAVQETAYPDNSPFPAASHEMALDRLTMLDQQNETAIALKLGKGALDDYYDAGGNKISNMADGVAATDAATVGQMDMAVTSAASGIVPGSIALTADLPFVNVTLPAYGAKGDGVTDDTAAIQAAIDYVASLGGGRVYLPGKTTDYIISSTLLIHSSNIILEGAGSGFPHDGGTNAAATSQLRWAGTPGGVMVEVGTPNDTAYATQSGQGLRNLALNANKLAGYGFKVISARSGIFSHVYVGNATVSAGLVTTYTSAGAAESRDTQECLFEQIHWRMLNGTEVQNAHGLHFTSASPGVATANASFNTIVCCNGQNVNGHSFLLEDADNNVLIRCTGYTTGTGSPFVFGGGYGNTIIGCSGGIKCLGTASGYWQNSYGNAFYSIDQANSWALTADTGCTYQFHGNRYGFRDLMSYRAVLANSSGGAATELANIGSDTLRISNTSQAGVTLTDGTSSYTISQDGSHNLRLTGSGGTNVLDMTQGSGVVPKFLSFLFGSSAKKILSGTAAPTTGAYSRGDIVLNELPAASGNIGWVCTSSGAPGTWKTWGTISA